MTLEAEIEALATLELGELIERYRELWGKEPRSRNREHLRKRIAWKLEEKRLGGLSATAKERLEELAADIRLPPSKKKRADPAPGSVLVKKYKGEEIRVTVVAGGYEHEGVLYRSLSALANAITGSHLNGRHFFGLTKRKAT